MFSISITAYTDIIINNLIAVFIIFIGFNGIRNTAVFTRIREIEETIDNKEGKLTAENKLIVDDSIDYLLMEQYFEKLKVFMNQEKPFLNEELTIHDLSIKTGIPKSYISAITKNKFNMNFFTFINSYRVDQFNIELLNPDNDNFTYLAIAMDCGFNSKSAFNRAYKNKTGLTPTQYKKTQLESKGSY